MGRRDDGHSVHVARYNDLKNIDRVEKVKTQVSDLASIMMSNLDAAADVADRMESVGKRAGE